MKSLTIDPRLLQPNPWNTNKVGPENEAKLDESIKRFGVFKPIICRELSDGTLEILGGEHRSRAAVRLGIKEVPVVNLGPIDDAKAKEIGLVDNGRYGDDDAVELANLLQNLGNSEALSKFLPYSQAEFDAIFSSISIDLDELDLTESDESADLPPLTEPPAQTHQVMRFKVPVEDCKKVSDLIESVMKAQGYTEEDALANAGNALVWVLSQYLKGQ